VGCTFARFDRGKAMLPAGRTETLNVESTQ
jgi:hypothetical protein